MKPLTNFEKMRINTQRRAEVRRRLFDQAMHGEYMSEKVKMFEKVRKQQQEGIRNDPNANPYVEAPKLGSWWPF